MTPDGPLHQLFGPKLSEFREEFPDGQRSIFVPSREAALAPVLDALPTSSFEALLPKLYQPDVECVVQWRDPDETWNAAASTGGLDAARALYALGAALVFVRPQAVITELTPWLSALRDELGLGEETDPYASLFASRPGSGLGRHNDTKDVWLVGLSGCKRVWTEPNRQQRVAPTNTVTSKPMAADANVYDVRRGDVLYIPRRMWHATESLEVDTFSISFAMMRPTRAELLLGALQRHLQRDSHWLVPIESKGEAIPRALLQELAQTLPALDWRKDQTPSNHTYEPRSGATLAFTDDGVVVEDAHSEVRVRLPPNPQIKEMVRWLQSQTKPITVDRVTEQFEQISPSWARGVLHSLFQAGLLRRR